MFRFQDDEPDPNERSEAHLDLCWWRKSHQQHRALGKTTQEQEVAHGEPERFSWLAWRPFDMPFGGGNDDDHDSEGKKQRHYQELESIWPKRVESSEVELSRVE